MKKEYRQAFTEVNDIIKIMPDELVNKIPNKFRNMIEEERDKEYTPNIQEPLENYRLKNETIIILGLIYRDFLCPPEERKRLQEKDAKEIQQAKMELEEELRQKYDPDNIFKQNKQETIEEQDRVTETVAMVEYKESFLKKIFNKVKSIFGLK